MRRLLFALVALVLARSAEAAIAVTVAPVCATHTTSTVVITLGSTPSAGDTVVYVAWSFDFGRTLNSVTDGNGGDAATVIAFDRSQGSPSFTRVQTAAFRVTTGHATITGTYSGSLTFTRGCAFAVSGAADPVAFDTFVGADTSSVTTHSSGNLTTTVADSLVLGAIAVTAAAGPTLPGGWTVIGATADGRNDYRILSSTTTLAYAPTTGSAASANVAITALRGTGGGGGGSAKRRTLLGVGP